MSRFHPFPAKLCSLLVASTMLLTGCQQQVEPDPQPQPGKPPASSDIWTIALIDGNKIGYSHLEQAEVTDNGQTYQKHHYVSELTLQRSASTTRQRTELTSIETEGGKLVSCQTQMSDGTADKITAGRVHNGKLTITTTIAGRQQQASIPWQMEWRGFFGVEKSLRSQPLKPGETRNLIVLAPVLMQPANIELVAGDYEPTTLAAGTQSLLKIDRADQLQVANGQTITINSTIWADQDGEILKTLLPGLGLEEYRTSREQALAKIGSRPFDINASFSIRLKRAVPDPHATRRVRYRIHIKDGQPSDFFAEGASQQIKSLEAGWAEIDVQAISPQQATVAAKQRQPTAEDTAANSLIQSDDDFVVAMANSRASDLEDPWQLACQLEKYVYQLIEKKDFSQVFASAKEVAQSRQGDCTEHAVLLAALCRARKIPARVAIGLVYVPRPGAPELAYHMWNEVWIKDGWYPLDATLGRGGIGGCHLKLTDTNLAGSSAFSAFLPVTQVVRRLQIEIVAVD